MDVGLGVYRVSPAWLLLTNSGIQNESVLFVQVSGTKYFLYRQYDHLVLMTLFIVSQFVYSLLINMIRALLNSYFIL